MRRIPKSGLVRFQGGRSDSSAVIDALVDGRLGGFATDVFEREVGVFHHDLGRQVMRDAALSRLLGMPNVIVTPHQGFFTAPAVQAIARITLHNASAFEHGRLRGEHVVVRAAESASLTA